MSARHWRQRAERLRHVARECSDKIERQTLLVLADDCERLAAQSEHGAEMSDDEN